MLHFFVDCPLATNFWQSFKRWYENTTETVLEELRQDVIFGNFSNIMYSDVLNYCLILAKYFIYTKKKQEKTTEINILHFLHLLKTKLNMMYEYSNINSQQEVFEFKWNIIYKEL